MKKHGPISFPEMYALLKKREKNGQPTAKSDELGELWGYDENVEDVTVRRRNCDFDKWLEREHGLLWTSTVHRRLYNADVARDYRRQPKKKSGGPFDPNASST